MSDQIIELKGSLFPISVLYCQDFSPLALKAQLAAKLAQAPGFFTLAPVVISVEQLEQAPDFHAIKQVFLELQLVLVGVCGASPALKKAAHAAGLAALQAPKGTKGSDGKAPAPAPSPPADRAEPHGIRTTIRSCRLARPGPHRRVRRASVARRGAAARARGGDEPPGRDAHRPARGG